MGGVPRQRPSRGRSERRTICTNSMQCYLPVLSYSCLLRGRYRAGYGNMSVILALEGAGRRVKVAKLALCYSLSARVTRDHLREGKRASKQVKQSVRR